MQLYKEEAISVAYKMALVTAGIKDVESRFEEHKSFLLEVLAPFSAEQNAKQDFVGAESAWSDEFAQKYADELTVNQKKVLVFMHNNGNKAALDDLVGSLQAGGKKPVNSYTLAGTLAGLTRKCDKYKVPYVYEVAWVENARWEYKINDVAYPFLKKHLES